MLHGHPVLRHDDKPVPPWEWRRTKRTLACRSHGGASTGPKTAAGRKRSGAKFLVHGRETKEIRTERRVKTAELQGLEALGRAIGLIVGPKTRGPKVKLG